MGNISRKDLFNYASTDTKPTAVPAYSRLIETDTGNEYEFSGSSWRQIGTAGATHSRQSGGTTDYGTYPQYSGLDIAYTGGAAAGTYVIASQMQLYHMGEFIITITALDTLEIRGRHADGTTSGILDAIGPTGAVVVLNATQLVAANNGRYRIPRFDFVDLIAVKVGANGTFTVIGRVASA